MARIHRQRASSAAPAATRHRLLTNRKKPSYKIVLEQVTQERKKLITVGSFHATPPPGYTFIPAGDPQITNRCKQLARQDGAKVYIVSTTKHRHAGNLSHQVHRIGYHFPSSIVGRACTSLGVDLSRSGHVLHHQPRPTVDPRLRPRPEKRSIGISNNEGSVSEVSQATIDTQAREAIKDLFPRIPKKDLHSIVTRAFEKDKGRVGTAPELSLPRRVQLAVVAHIRHNYTKYDKLLRQVPYLTARAMVEQPSLDKLAEWRGDDDEDPNAMEEILREVIVIPDDDEEENMQDVLGTPGNPGRQASIEVISSRTIADDLETRAIDYGTKADLLDRGESPESDDAEIQYLGHGQYAFGAQDRRGDQKRNHRIGVHRQRAWEQALDRHRKEPTNLRPNHDLSQEHEVLKLSRPDLHQVIQVGSHYSPEENYVSQVQSPTHIRRNDTILERAIFLPNRHGDAQTQPERPISYTQTLNHHPNYDGVRHISALRPSQAEAHLPSEYRKVAHKPVLSYAGYEASRANVASQAAVDPDREERVFTKLRSTRLEPGRIERILPSIEIPSRLHRVTSDISDARTSNFRSIDDFDFRVADGPDDSSPPSPTSRKAKLDQSERLNFFKRRRFNLPDEQGQELFEINTGLRDSQRSILVPVEDRPRPDEQLQRNFLPQRTENLQTFVMENRPAPFGSLTRTETGGQQHNDPIFMHPNENTVKLRDEPSYHSQVLLSPGLSRSDARSHKFQNPLNNQVPMRMSRTYGSDDPYAYSQRHDFSPNTPSRDLISTARDVTFSGEERVRRPVFGQPSQLPSYHKFGEETYADPNSGLVHEQPDLVNSDQQQTRTRRYLPLKSSFGGLRPPKNTWLEHRSVQTSTRFQVPSIRPANASLYQQATPHNESIDESPGYRGQNAMLNRIAVPDFYHDNQRSPGRRQKDERGVIVNTGAAHLSNFNNDYAKYSFEGQESIPQRPRAVINRAGHRMIDTHTGREVIVLE